jgi:hypothetical protein
MDRTVIQHKRQPSRLGNFDDQIRRASRDRERQFAGPPQIAAGDLTGPPPTI